MSESDLYIKLLQAYSVNNLNRISLTLITLYKEEQFTILQKITELIGDFVCIEIKDDGKGFSKLMMLYHPDRANFHIQEINTLNDKGNNQALLKYSHILELEKIEEIAASFNHYEDIDYSPVYEWDIDTSGFRVFNDFDTNKVKHRKKRGGSFYDAIKMREYGHTDIEFPWYYLEDIEKFELSSSEIDDLDGVQFCIHAKSIDLSDNLIFDLNLLIGLNQLKKLNLSDNQIGYIDSLALLINLKSLDLSNNQINDITPLFELEHLKYVCLTGNPVERSQINDLLEFGVEVDF
jgi:Leucine-rich repeat (LRR) protein